MDVWPTTTEKTCNKVSRWVRFGQLLEVNFVQKLPISNHLPKRIFTKSCWEGPSFVGCTFLIHSLFFPAFPSSFLTFLCYFPCSHGVFRSSSHSCEYTSCPLVPVHLCCIRQLSNPYPPVVHHVWPWHMQLLICSTTRLQACHCISLGGSELPSNQLHTVTPNETIEELGVLCGTTQTSLKGIFTGQAHVDRL